MENNDKVLLKEHCAGNHTAFGELLRRHGPALLGYLVRMTGNTDSAEDIFQETFMRVHQKAHLLKTDKFKTWLFTIATRVALNTFKKNNRIKCVSLDTEPQCEHGNCPSPAALALPDHSPGPAQAVVMDEQKQIIRQAIDRLPHHQRITLLLAYYQKMNYSEVAQVLGCSQGSVKTHMFRALKTLATILPDPTGGNA